MTTLILASSHFQESATGKPDITGDVEAIYRLLEDQINMTRQELAQPTIQNPLTGHALDIRHTAERQLTFPKEGWRKYASNKLSQFHFGAHDHE